ncbi:hypothetical protein PL75_03235 [Neisseria arctica]|uniref:Phage tail protein n=1 Tax=Neisseria arctica TaxID=1470200 RepID=A0A0J1C4L5_9NEIS|nr:phage tail tube protein [Neisseria arctica]KLT73253.1 hypothetical protein PL75_03235 [Neisseria arctica]UOO87493.1 phage tail tube protein [Neisseria arctica]
MSSGAKQVLYIVAETVAGTTPASPKWLTLPFKTSSLDGTVNKTDSDTIADGRLGRGGLPTSMEVAGDIQVNAAFATYDDLLAAAFFNNWSSETLAIGSIRKTFSAVRGYTDIANYQTFTGLHVANFALEIPEEGLVTMTFGMAGLNRSQANSVPAGTITPPVLNEEFTNVGVGELTVDGQSLKGVACVTAFSFNLDNGLQVQRCLGSGLAVGKQLEGKAKVTGSFTVAWSTKAAELYEKKFNNGKIALKIPFGDGAGNRYELSLPVVTINGSLPSGGAEELLTTQFEYTVQDQSPILKRVTA